MNDTYAMRRELTGTTYAEAVERVTEALASEGFGVLTTIDVRETFKQKLELDFRPYLIIGACNPQLAHRALSEEPSIGLLLPCNVVVEETDVGAVVSIARPRAMLGIAEAERLQGVADEAEERLSRVLQQV
jgi:uncharacterized protein (DUF302 family)